MIQLEIVRGGGGEVSGEALLAYLRYFEETLMKSDHLSDFLALFGWQPDILPMDDKGEVDLIV
jgi:hypothetical protein